MQSEFGVGHFQKNGFRYTKYVGDGDSKGFDNIVNSYEGMPVEKLECIGHVQKRVGTRLRNLKKKNKGLGGKGKLTDKKIDKLQNYYGIGIRRNTHSLEAMQKAARAVLFHVASSATKNYHDYCPKGADSWCKYNLDRLNGTST